MSSPLDPRAVRRAFQRAAPGYEDGAFLFREIEDRLLERVALLKIEPARILDLGTGPGRAAESLKRRFRKARVVALDLAPGMASRARARSRWLRPVDALCADAARLPLASGTFDLAFSNLMLPWVTERAVCFDELRRVLGSGGVLLFTTLGPDTLKEFREAWDETGESAHVHGFDDMHHIGDELVAAGFDDPVMDAEFLTVNYEDVMGLARDLKRTGAHNASTERPRALTGKARWRRMRDAYERLRTADGLPATCEVVYGHALAPPEGRPRRTAEGQEATFSVDNLRSTIRRREP